MPYVEQPAKDRITLPYVSTLGELTYVIDRIAEELLWKRCDYDFGQLRYDDLAAVRGAMSNAVDEFYRRVVVPFEDQKILTNGDVFIFPHPEQWQISATKDTVDIAVIEGEVA